MENRENSRRRWPVAVTVSVILHGAALLAFSLISSRQGSAARTAAATPWLSFCVLEGDAGEVRFEGPSARDGGPSPHHLDKKRETGEASVEPMTSSLREPWTAGAEESEASAISLKPSNPGRGVHGDGPATSFFHVAAGGQRIVYLVDGSATMGKKGALKAACRELDRSVRQLPGSARFQIIIYNHEPHYLLPSSFRQWLEPAPATVSAVAAALDGKAAEGATNHTLALREAFRLQPPADVVFFLTDGEDLRPEHLRLVGSLNQGRAIVNTIDLNNRNRAWTETPLQTLARDHRGVYQVVDLERERW
jgi:hypothetical protein